MRLLIVDDHKLFRDALAEFLSRDPEFLVSACPGVAEALAAIRAEPVDLVLLDMKLAGEEGIEFLLGAQDCGFAGKVLLVTAGADRWELFEALQAGAAGIFAKNQGLEELVERIRTLAAGDTRMDALSIEVLRRGVEEEDAITITERERTVLRGVFEGRANKEIAAGLGLSETAVKAVLQRLFAKTGVRTRAQLVRVALERYGHYLGD